MSNKNPEVPQSKRGFRAMIEKYKLLTMDVDGYADILDGDLNAVRTATQFLRQQRHGRWTIRQLPNGMYRCWRTEHAMEGAASIELAQKKYFPEGSFVAVAIPTTRGAIEKYGMLDMTPGSVRNVPLPEIQPVRAAIQYLRLRGTEGFSTQKDPNSEYYFLYYDLPGNQRGETGEEE